MNEVMKGDAAKREKKHLCIISQRKRLNSKIEDLDNLVKRINGKGRISEPTGPDEQESTLLIFLDSESSILSGMTDKIGKITQSLDAMLF